MTRISIPTAAVLLFALAQGAPRAEPLPDPGPEFGPTPETGASASTPGGEAENQFLTVLEAVALDDEAVAYIVTDKRGRRTVVPNLRNLRLAPGETVEALAMAEGYPATLLGLSATALDLAAKEAATDLLHEARAAACALDPRPRTIAPSVTVSVSDVQMTVRAEWETADVCLGDPDPPTPPAPE